RKVFGADHIGVDGDLHIRVLPLPAISIPVTIYMQGVVQADGGIFHIAGGKEPAFKDLEVLLHITLQVHVDEFVPGITEVAVFYMLHLLIDDDGANDENNRGGELRDDEALSDEDGADAGFYPDALQNEYRVEGREVDGGVAAGNQSGDYGNSQQAGPMRKLEEMDG